MRGHFRSTLGDEMTIPRTEAVTFLEKNKLRYGGFLVNPSIDSDYGNIDVFSHELPISGKKEYEITETVGKKYDLKLIFQDFSLGEGVGKGMESDYESVFVATCRSLDELKEAPTKIAKAIAELEEKILKP